MHFVSPQAAKPDHWESVTGNKLPRSSKAHKPADSGVVVGRYASWRSFQDVSLNAIKHALQNTPFAHGETSIHLAADPLYVAAGEACVRVRSSRKT